MIGLNPAIAESLVDVFGAKKVRITDLNPDNVGRTKYGVEIWNGRTRTEDLVKASNVVLLTGTTLVNGTFDAVWKGIERYGKEYLILRGYFRRCVPAHGAEPYLPLRAGMREDYGMNAKVHRKLYFL